MARFVDRNPSSESFQPIFLGLGSNLGDRESNLISGLASLAGAGGSLESVSSCYQTTPQGGPPGQADYLNLACQISWSCSPLELLEICQSVEVELGRVRSERWAARTLDIDILLMGRRVIMRDRLLIPHPRMASRAFVLVPLAEISRSTIHPVFRKTISTLLSELESNELIGPHPWGAAAQARLDCLVS